MKGDMEVSKVGSVHSDAKFLKLVHCLTRIHISLVIVTKNKIEIFL